MKVNRLMLKVLLLLLSAAAFELLAHPTEAERKKFVEIKAKAEKGDAEAQNNLGVCYEKGKGVAKDSAEALKWYRKAAGQNDANAQSNLGFCYAKGQGVPTNSVE